MSSTTLKPGAAGGTPPAHTILGHPDALFVLFFTEMWERFSYYGMRALIVLFLVTETVKGGWGWSRADAATLYGTYTGLVYITPIIGGYIADKILGLRRAIVLGGFIIAAGHATLLLDTQTTFYIGLGLVCLGTGLFKPNISAIVGQLYNKDNEGGRDGGYTLFYMGVNSGAFFGILLCGYIGEKISWPLGFGLAGLFMLLGAIQFYFGQGIFGNIGLAPKQESAEAAKAVAASEAEPHVVADRLKAIFVFSFFTIFFWFAFEQAGGSMTIFAADYTDRTLVGTSGFVFKVINSLLTVIPTLILSWLLIKLFAGTAKRYLLSNALLLSCIGMIWALVLWMLNREFGLESSEVPATWFGVLNSFF
ncbi:MAG TPA: oligopeptide:H+ symporter, partial [Burkholderiaceae bacterium]